MAGLESTALKAGNAVVTQVVRAWLTRRKVANRRGADLTELIALRFDGVSTRSRRDLVRKLEAAGDAAGDQLRQLCEREFDDLDEADRAAAVDTAVDALADADLSDETVLRAAVDPVALARDVRRQVPSAPRRAGLGESARGLFDLVLDRICVQLIHLVRELPEYEERLAEESLRRLGAVLSGIDQILERLPTTSLDAPAGADRDEEFRRRYLDTVARKHDDLELIGVSVRNFRPRTKLSVAYLSLTADTGFQAQEPVFDPEGVAAERVGGSQTALRKLVLRQPAGDTAFGHLAELPELRRLDLHPRRADDDTVDLTELRNDDLVVSVDHGARVVGGHQLPAGTNVVRRRRFRYSPERGRKSARHAYRY